MKIPDDRVRPARLKIERAEHHITDLNGRIQAYLAENPFKVIEHHDAKTREMVVRVKTEKPIPEVFPLIIGDAVHNLRSALDLTIFALVAEHPDADIDNIAFPFTRKQQGLKSAINKGQVHLAGKKVVEAIDAIQPYPDGNHYLYGLHRLDAHDKHRLIIVTVAHAMLTGDELRGAYPGFDPSDDYIFTNPQNVPLLRLTQRDYGDRNTRRRLGRFQKQANLTPLFGIGFGEGQPFENDLVVGSLLQMHAAVVDAVGRVLRAWVDT